MNWMNWNWVREWLKPSEEVSMDQDMIAMYDGTVLLVHNSSQCLLTYCCIHNPSNHHMITWPQYWIEGRNIMARVCPHSEGHPDPDDVRIVLGRDSGLHPCDGCCLENGYWAPP